jgi:beta-N-acetylhexosaminidase
LSDDSEMRALVDHFGPEESAVRAVSAGVDLFLVCHTPSRAHQGIDALVRAVESGELPRQRLSEARARVEAFLVRFAAARSPASDLSILRSDEHLALAAELEASSIIS